MAKDYYQILGIVKGASEADIKKAYRELAHKHHPDKEGGNEAKFKEINEAYQVLGDPKKKAQYDQYGQTFDQAGPGFGGFSGFGGQNVNFDMGGLGEMFGEMFGQRSRGAARAHDIEVSMTISFAEAAFGVEKTVELYKPIDCKACSGAGMPVGAKMHPCNTCGGQGRVRVVQRTILGSFESVATCETCQGTGNVPDERCKTCVGAGTKREKTEVRVKIPAGIEEGETVRLQGQGEAAGRGAMPGDLYIHMRVKPDPRFEREGFDVASRLSVSFAEAALGTEREVETLDGPLTVKVPAGVQSGTEIRLKGRGVHRLQSSGRGDHFVRVSIQTPEHLSKKARQLLEELKKEGI